MKATQTERRILINNILFLSDLSAASERGARYASKLAEVYDSRLVAAHVRPLMVNPDAPPLNWYETPEITEAANESCREELRAMFPGQKLTAIAAEGDYWLNVREIIRTEHIDLIVMTTRGRSGAPRLLLGSVAEETFRNAPCPVLTVGPLAPAETNGFTRILFATDLTPEANEAVKYALSIAQEEQAHLTLMHVVGESRAEEQIEPHDVMAADERVLKTLVPEEAERWCVADVLVEKGDVAKTILDAAKRRNTDLIVMGVHKESGVFGAATHLPIAVVHEVVSKALCPVLTVPI